MTAFTVQASRLNAQGWQTEQSAGLSGNGTSWLAWHSEGFGCTEHKNQKLSTIRGSAQPENTRSQDCAKMEERKWQQFFEDPSTWWDNRRNKRNSEYPDFEHASTGESLLIDSYFCPKWVPPRLKRLEDSGPAVCQVLRKDEWPKFQSGRRSDVGHKKLPSNTKCEGREAIRIYDKTREDGVRPSISIVVAALKACSSSRDLQTGKRIHADGIESGDDSNIYVANTLVDMYAKCGSMVDARRVFDRMLHHSVVSWNTIILGYAQSGEGKLALQLFAQMQEEGFTPNARTFIAALKSCTSLAAKEEGKHVEGGLVKVVCLEKGIAMHSQVAKSGHDSDIFVANTLVDMYVKCGSMVDARRVFDRMLHHDVVSWNAIILGYAQSGEGVLALQLFAQMHDEGFTPNDRTFVAVINACTSLAAKEEAKQVDGEVVKTVCLEKGAAIHSQVAKSGHDSDIFVANSLVDMYSKCGSMVDARRVFERMSHHDIVSWNAIISGYAQSGEGELALQLFEQMQDKGFTPDARTFVAALKSCTCLAAKEEGEQIEGELVKTVCLEKGMAIHSQVAKSGHDSDVFVASTLVDMYAKCGSMMDARRVFDRMPRPDVVSWNAIILGYAQSGEGELVALQLFERMQDEGFIPDARTFVAALNACTNLAAKEEGKEAEEGLVKVVCLEKGRTIHSQVAKSGDDSDIFVANALVDMYSKCGSMVDARKVFDRMQHHDVVSWTAIILGYAQSGEGDLALQLFSQMHDEGSAPNARTFVAALKACGSLAALETGKRIHAEICSAGLQSGVVVANCLVDFYGKCGSMVDAQQVFDSIPTRDLVTWSALMAGYSRQGDTKHVFDLFERMQKECLQPDGVTFLSILTACSHAGLVEKGKEYFQAMCSDYLITAGIEHYTCVVDLLGRANHLDDAVAMVKSMPFEPNLKIWTTVLGACRKWRNVAVGRLAFEAILRLDDIDAAAYVLMANIYAGAGMWEESAKVQAMRRNARDWKKKSEQSWWTDNAGMVHTFVVGDTSHPQSEDIQAKLKDVLVNVKEEDYYVSGLAKESALCGHTEKLAIACALINTAPRTPIRIVKNLRVCDDCHKATAVISKVEQRAIICRDASQLHVFKDGKCSCGNFW